MSIVALFQDKHTFASAGSDSSLDLRRAEDAMRCMRVAPGFPPENQNLC